MQTIVLASRKGGAGKTTISCHLAVEAERAGDGPVAIIDTDNMAGLSRWWDARKATTPVIFSPKTTLAIALDEIRELGYRWVIIDTPPALNNSVSDTVLLADLVLVPVQPTPDDLLAVQVTVDLVKRTKKPLVFVINRVKPRVKLTGQAAIALSQHGMVAPIMVWDRVDYAAAKIDGLTAPEVEPGGKAAEEVRDLWAYVKAQVGEAA
jgi:chromosome partitioning protein